jgi:ribonuclease Z
MLRVKPSKKAPRPHWTRRRHALIYSPMPAQMVDKRIGGLRVLGYSLAGEETVIAVPELNVCFDPGRAPPEIISIDNLCLSHGHMDHAAGVAYYLSQRGFIGNAPGRIIVHRRLARHLHRLMGVWADLEGHPSPAVIEPVVAGDQLEIRRGLVVRAFDVNHCEGALGFAVVERRHKLRAEFAGHTGPQLVELKGKGVDIHHHIEVPLVVHCGDTAAGGFLDLDHVREARVIFLECTFFAPEHVSRARAGQHIHVSDLPGILSRLNNPHVVLTHLTRRTGMREAKNALREVLSPTDLDRVSILMDRPRRHARSPRIPRDRDEQPGGGALS